MNDTVKDALGGILANLDSNIVWKSEEVYDRKVCYEVATSELAELREKRHQIQEFLSSKPRVWESIYDVPIKVEVKDAQGDTWKWTTEAGWQCWWAGGNPDPEIYDAHRYAPFTEIV